MIGQERRQRMPKAESLKVEGTSLVTAANLIEQILPKVYGEKLSNITARTTREKDGSIRTNFSAIDSSTGKMLSGYLSGEVSSDGKLVPKKVTITADTNSSKAFLIEVDKASRSLTFTPEGARPITAPVLGPAPVQVPSPPERQERATRVPAPAPTPGAEAQSGPETAPSPNPQRRYRGLQDPTPSTLMTVRPPVELRADVGASPTIASPTLPGAPPQQASVPRSTARVPSPGIDLPVLFVPDPKRAEDVNEAMRSRGITIDHMSGQSISFRNFTKEGQPASPVVAIPQNDKHLGTLPYESGSISERKFKTAVKAHLDEQNNLVLDVVSPSSTQRYSVDPNGRAREVEIPPNALEALRRSFMKGVGKLQVRVDAKIGDIVSGPSEVLERLNAPPKHRAEEVLTIYKKHERSINSLPSGAGVEVEGVKFAKDSKGDLFGQASGSVYYPMKDVEHRTGAGSFHMRLSDGSIFPVEIVQLKGRLYPIPFEAYRRPETGKIYTVKGEHYQPR